MLAHKCVWGGGGEVGDVEGRKGDLGKLMNLLDSELFDPASLCKAITGIQ